MRTSKLQKIKPDDEKKKNTRAKLEYKFYKIP